MIPAGADTTRFFACLPFTLTEEGGNSNDPHDPGGRTHKGIIQREYDLFRQKQNLPLQSDYLMSDDEVQTIYWGNYWTPFCPLLFPGLDLSFFDQSVNEGPREATLLLQRALRIQADGIFGDETKKALTAVTAPDDRRTLVSNYSDARAAFYRSLRTFQYFGTDWLRRTGDIEDASLAMVA